MTLVFWLLVGLMTAIALVAVVRPLVRSGSATASPSLDLRLAAYRARLAEFDQEVAGGALSAEQADAARIETERELLRAVELPDAIAVAGNGAARRTAVSLLVVVPLVSVALYFHLGQPALIESRTSAPHPDGAGLEQMVEQLSERLQRTPDDVAGWRLLARSYSTLGRNEEALAVLEQINKTHGNDADVLVDLAQVLASVNNGQYTGRPASLLERALALAPDHNVALWLGGAAAMEAGESDRAVAYWERLIPLLDSAEAVEEVRAMIAHVQGEAPPAPTATDAQQADSQPFSLRVRVEISPELATEAATDAVLFVTARAANGPPMPLAAVRLPAPDLPTEVILDETTMMIPDTPLTKFERLDLAARLSRSGQANRQSGDLIGELLGVNGRAETPRTLVIDTRVP